MSSRAKKRSKKNHAFLFAQVKRNLEKGNHKQALKDARVCFRQAPTKEHRQYLELTHIARAQELQRMGNREACRNVVQSLLDSGVTEPSVQAALPDVLLKLGMLDQLPDDCRPQSDAEHAEWNAKLADQAVVQQGNALDLPPALRDEAAQVRRALDLLYSGEESAALAQLNGVARTSLFADWKLLVRGLAAYYRQDVESMQANWSRLDPDRVAARIARPLSVLMSDTPAERTDPGVRAAIARIERGVGEKAIQTQLIAMRTHLAEEDWPRAFQSFRAAQTPLRQLDEGLYQRLLGWLTKQIVEEGELADLNRLSKLAEPLPLDPHWNRARAMLYDYEDDDEKAMRYWRKYADDLSGVSDLAPSDRELAQALVWLHLGESHAKDVTRLRECPCGEPHVEEVAEAVESAEECLEQAIRLFPTHAAGYEALAELYSTTGEPDNVASICRRCLEYIPDSFNALLLLAQHYIEQDQPLEAQEFAQRLRKLKPLDVYFTKLVWATHVGAARHYALRREFDQGREQFCAADELIPGSAADYDILGKRAALETKAGCVEEARRLIEQAQETLEEPTPLWLLMMIEAKRYRLAKDEKWLYEKRWTEALRRRCNGSTAGHMCRLVVAYLNNKAHQPRQSDVKRLVAYVKRCTRVKWCEHDLRAVCKFLKKMEDDALTKFIRKGLKKFPACGYFHFLDGKLEFERGPASCQRKKAQRSLEKAIELLKRSDNPGDAGTVDEAKRMLTMLEEFPEPRFSTPFPFPIPFFSSLEEDDDEEEEVESVGSDDLASMFVAMCERMGLDPQETLDDLAARTSESSRGERRRRHS